MKNNQIEELKKYGYLRGYGGKQWKNFFYFYYVLC
jgi:hypothetical protein